MNRGIPWSSLIKPFEAFEPRSRWCHENFLPGTPVDWMMLSGKTCARLRIAQAHRYVASRGWLSGILVCLVASANATPCDRVTQTLTSSQRASLSAIVASQLQAHSAKILGSYRLSNWYLLHVDTPDAAQAFLFYRGDPSSRQYVALWSRSGSKPKESDLRSWARMQAPGVPETLGKCFAWAAAR